MPQNCNPETRVTRLGTVKSSGAMGVSEPWLRLCIGLVSAVLSLNPCTSVAQDSDARNSTITQRDAVQIVSIFYATNRGRKEQAPGRVAYNGDRGGPHFGTCLVEFSPIPFAEDLGSIAPFYIPRETNRISIAEEFDENAFWADLMAAAGQTTSRSVVLFVHGYNYGFARTCRMAAELQRTLSGKATVVMVSWPSNALPTDYLPDQVDLEWSVPFLADVFSETVTRLGATRVQSLAHSMGSRGVLFTLQRLGADLDRRPIIRRLVLLAPDFDSATFVALVPRLTPLVEEITLYASSNDTALIASRQLNGNPRLGEAGDFLTVVNGIETIDVSPGGRYQILGHEYFYYHPWVAADLAELLGSGSRASERRTLRTKQRGGLTFWEISVEAQPQ